MLVDPQTFRRLCRARDRLSESLDQQVSVRTVAKEIAASPFHFIRQFESVFGETPHQFRTRVRIERAKDLLATGERSVTETCFELGYSSLGSFSDLFRRHVGDSPSAYRKRIRTLVQVPHALHVAFVPGCVTLMGMLPPWAFRNFREA